MCGRITRLISNLHASELSVTKPCPTSPSLAGSLSFPLASMQVVVSGTVAAGAVSALAIGAAVVAALGTAASSGGGGGGGADPGAGNAVR